MIAGLPTAEISVAGQPVIRFRSLSPSNRADTVAERLKNALRRDATHANARSFTIGTLHVVAVDESIIATADDATAILNRSSAQGLATQWASNIHIALRTEYGKGVNRFALSLRDYILQVPVLTAIVAFAGVALLGPWLNNLYSQNQRKREAQNERLSKQISVSASLTEHIDRLLALHNLEYDLKERKATLDRYGTWRSNTVQAEYSEIASAWVRALEAIAHARGDFAASSMAVDLYFDDRTRSANGKLREAYNKRGESFKVTVGEPIFAHANDLLRELAREIRVNGHT